MARVTDTHVLAPVSWPEVLNTLVAGGDLTGEQTEWAMGQVMSGEVSPARLAAFLMGLRAKGETVAELRGLTAAMLAAATRIEVPGPLVDIVGTGGDRAGTVNISTMAAIVAAGAGLRVVKHGNRAASSKAGSADLLEALDIRLDHSPERVAQIATEAGITFCFATVFHPSMRHAGTARKELGIPTAFNFLGPLTNPAQPRAAAVGCADARMAPLMAGVFAERGTSALVFRGDDGLDELATTAPATIWEVHPRWLSGVETTLPTTCEVTKHHLDLADALDLPRVEVAQLRGGDAGANAAIARAVLDGSLTGAIRDTVALNAAAALVADGTLVPPASGNLPERLRQGVELAQQAIESGAAQAALQRWQAASR